MRTGRLCAVLWHIIIIIILHSQAHARAWGLKASRQCLLLSIKQQLSRLDCAALTLRASLPRVLLVTMVLEAPSD
jgi:hypothetical protein